MSIREGSQSITATNLEILHSKMNTIGLAVGNSQVTRPSSSCGNHHSVELRLKFLGVNIYTYVRIGDECLWDKMSIENGIHSETTYHALSSHEIKAALDNRLIQLHAI